MSKRVYLFLTVSLVLLSIGTGFAMQHRKTNLQLAIQSLQRAQAALDKETVAKDSPRWQKSRALVDEALQTLQNEPASSQP